MLTFLMVMKQAFFSKLIPDKTFRLKGETCADGKLSKERLTVFVVANMSGTEKRPLLVIGKPRNPGCFKNVRNLPVDYKNNTKAWMTSSIFKAALTSWDAKLRRKKRKILLLVDNCPSHCEVDLEYIRLVFLPPNTTSVMQPMVQGIIKCLKGYYRKLLVLKIIADLELKKETSIAVLDAVLMLHQSWNEEVSTSTIANCFRHSGLSDQAPSSAPADFDIANQLQTILPLATSTSVNISDHLVIDDEINTAATLTEDEIVANIQKTCDNQEEETDTEDTFGNAPSAAQARAALQTLLQFCILNEETTYIPTLKNLETKFNSTLLTRCRQSTIDDF